MRSVASCGSATVGINSKGETFLHGVAIPDGLHSTAEAWTRTSQPATETATASQSNDESVSALAKSQDGRGIPRGRYRNGFNTDHQRMPT